MNDSFAVLARTIDALGETLIQARRHLHAHPEPSREEFETARFLADRLAAEGIPYRMACGGRGVIAGPEPILGGVCVAVRGDIDALRIAEQSAVPYRSQNAGLMHACGHDAHAVMALGAAIALHRCPESLPEGATWRAILQPAEEVGEGGQEMVAEGAVVGVAAILGLHVDPTLQVGRIGFRAGAFTAHCQDLEIEVIGRGGHAARPHLTIDPIATAAQLVSLLYQNVPRTSDAREAVVVSFGMIAGGASPNVIPDRVSLRGTIRTLSRESAHQVCDRITTICRGVAEISGATITAAFPGSLGAVRNDPTVTAQFARAAAEVVGVANVEAIPLPSMGGEDFSAYLDAVPGCMLRLGVAKNEEPQPGLHTPTFDIDERALLIGSKILAQGVVEIARSRVTN